MDEPRTEPPDPGADRVAGRSDLLPEESGPGSDDPTGQAEAILEDSDERSAEVTEDPPG